MSKIANVLVLFSLLMALSFGVAFAEQGMTSNGNASMNNTSIVAANNTTVIPAANNTSTEAVPLNNTTATEKK